MRAWPLPPHFVQRAVAAARLAGLPVEARIMAVLQHDDKGRLRKVGDAWFLLGDLTDAQVERLAEVVAEAIVPRVVNVGGEA